MASPKNPALVLLLVSVLAAVLASPAAGQQQQQEYCRDTLGGLEACHAFMYEGAAQASSGCCAAYSAAFDADPFCLCYIANGVYGRSTGYNVNVTHALEIPTSCGQVAPPIDLCNMQGLVLPPYEPEAPAAPRPAQAPQASSPAAQPPSASAGSVETPPSTLLSPTPPPPQPTSGGSRDSSVQMALVFFSVACMVAAVA